MDYESHAVALDRNELGALLVAAGLGSSTEHALISLLALNGLRVSEAVGADVEHLGLERGYRTLTVTREGGKIVTIPLAPRTAPGGSSARPPAGPDRQDRHAPHAQTRVHHRRAGAGVPLRDVQVAASHADPRTTMRYDRARGSLDRHATYIVAAYLAGAAR